MTVHDLGSPIETSDIVGRRYIVLKPSAWFPHDFTVLARTDTPGFLRVENKHETYLVAEARFYAELGATFCESVRYPVLVRECE